MIPLGTISFVGSHSEAMRYFGQLNEGTRAIAMAMHAVLAEQQACDSYVKTIYVGYDIEGEMVAALYGHANHVEIALALPEEADSPLLVDASHLTWRTLPLAAIVRRDDDLLDFTGLAALACERVREATHDVVRDNEFFIKSRESRRSRR